MKAAKGAHCPKIGTSGFKGRAPKMAVRDWIRLALRAWRIRRKGDPELRWLPQLVGRGRRCIDIGANPGVFTYWLAKAGGCVEAFEPNPGLADNLIAAGLANVTVHRVALGNSIETASLFVPFHSRSALPAQGGASKNIKFDDPAGRICEPPSDLKTEQGIRFETPASRLDSFSFADVDFIKIDVEGHEEKVLDGGWETIVANRPRILIELEERHRPGCVARVASRFKAIDYRVGFLDHGLWYDLEVLGTGESGQQAGPSGRYINNFLLIPSDQTIDSTAGDQRACFRLLG
ncbi:MAG: FkbM family methyltransferase [Rhodospirillales bacterium]|jgi:FkbM family methyltransferase|nr:FkbM family methyltransferase [Rhodospirillales bacterium]MBT4006400.1 FkbM family methyltransferase [Rhodospirillales bacterium]MBT5075142.1 FkbM family methyltransferase [Rhodospirillales bacterium]MBT5114277.1 FkbM family methyltransferase [Rhodospirillales bacterium]MBT6186652.1 FkbM family methyltransferase [Rhodospirillales bacterium]